MQSDKTVKELKQILDEHNCAIPNGAKKKDLVELVEAVMAKDEDFVTNIDIQQLGRPAKEWVYPLAFLALGLAVLTQLLRRRSGPMSA